jgi:fermentation-respiration switch protein FrsA (DUF1100 family)
MKTEPTVLNMPNLGGVTAERVTYRNRNIQSDVVGNLFKPVGFDASKQYPAIVVTHPFGGTKEQTAGRYAALLAQRGFITLAFDASYQGESGGLPRFMEIPASRVEDIRCGVDFLSNHPSVDPERIGALGVCAGGGYTMNAAQTDWRIKAAAGVSTFDIGSARREGVQGAIPVAQRLERQEKIGELRTHEAAGAPLEYVNFLPENAEAAAKSPSELYREGYDYYCVREEHPNEMKQYVFSSLGQQMAFFPFEQIETISPRPILLIAGSRADTRYYSENAVQKAHEPKELFVVPGASHIDLYYKPEFVPIVANKLADFFTKGLARK